MESLDDRAMWIAQSLPTDKDRQAVQDALAHIREAWSGADHYAEPAWAFERIADSAKVIAEIFERTQAR